MGRSTRLITEYAGCGHIQEPAFSDMHHIFRQLLQLANGFDE